MKEGRIPLANVYFAFLFLIFAASAKASEEKTATGPKSDLFVSQSNSYSAVDPGKSSRLATSRVLVFSPNSNTTGVEIRIPSDRGGYMNSKESKPSLFDESERNAEGPPDLRIVSITSAAALRNGEEASIDVLIENNGGQTAIEAMLYVFTDGFQINDGYDLGRSGLSIPPGEGRIVAVPFSDTRRFIGDTEFKFYVETSDDPDLEDNWLAETFHFDANLDRVPAMPMYYVAYKYEINDEPYVNIRWARKDDPNRKNYLVAYREAGEAEWSFIGVDNAMNGDFVGPFPEGAVYEFTAGVRHNDGSTAEIVGSDVTTLKTSGDKDLYTGDVSGIVTIHDAPAAGIYTWGYGVGGDADDSGYFFYENAPNGTTAAWVHLDWYDKIVTKFEVPDGGQTNGVRIFTRLKEDSEPPAIESFEIRYEDDFVLKNQHGYTFLVHGTDNVQVRDAEFHCWNPDDNEWIFIAKVDFDGDSAYHEWQVPADWIGPGYMARAVLTDYRGNRSDFSEWGPFEIVDGTAPTGDIQVPGLNGGQWQIGEEKTIAWTIDAPYPLESIDWIKLHYGLKTEEIFNNVSPSATSVSYAIPMELRYATENAYLSMYACDANYNCSTDFSDPFSIGSANLLPTPFNESILVYDDAFDFPSDALDEKESSHIENLRLDENGVAHMAVEHSYKYFRDTGASDGRDFFDGVKYKYYVSYDKADDILAPKVRICDSEYDVADMRLISGIPHALLQSADGKNRYCYTRKNGPFFVEPIPILNQTVPELSEAVKTGSGPDSEMSRAGEYAFANGYLWKLDISSDRISRYAFSDESVGAEERINIGGSADGLNCSRVIPATDGDMVYFLDYSKPKLAKLDTTGPIATAYDTPFSVDKDDSTAYRTCMVAMNGELFVFFGGKVYSLENGSVTEKGPVAYEFDGQTVDYSTMWGDVDYARAVVADDRIILVMGGPFNDSKPVWTQLEVLEFDPDDCTFSKTLAQTQARFTFDDSRHDSQVYGGGEMDVQYLGDDKLLAAYGANMAFPPLKYYETYFQILDLETGAVDYLGGIEEIEGVNIALVEQGGNVYAFVENLPTLSCDVFRLNISNLSARPVLVEFPRLLEYDNDLYAVWTYGNVFDGTWDYSEGRVMYHENRRNRFARIYPSLGQVTDFGNRYYGYAPYVVGPDIVWSDSGEMYALNDDFTVDQLVFAMESRQSELEFKSFDDRFVAGFAARAGDGIFDFTLLESDLEATTFQGLGQGSDIAAFGDEVVWVGYDYSPDGSNYVAKLDLSSGAKYECRFGNANTGENYKKVDINENRIVAVAWGNYVAVGDLSESEQTVVVDLVFSLQGSDRPYEGFSVSTTVVFHPSGSQEEAYRFEVVSEKSGGRAIIRDLRVAPGEYDIVVSSAHALASVKRGAIVAEGDVEIDMCFLAEGDANDDGVVDIHDFGILSASFDKAANDPGYDSRADFDENEKVDADDFELWKASYLGRSPLDCGSEAP